MYVLCTLNVCIMYVFVCIDFDDMDYFLESNILTDVHMSMDSNSSCSHHSNRVFYFSHITHKQRYAICPQLPSAARCTALRTWEPFRRGNVSVSHRRDLGHVHTLHVCGPEPQKASASGWSPRSAPISIKLFRQTPSAH